jgi:hypothetical protein
MEAVEVKDYIKATSQISEALQSKRFQVSVNVNSIFENPAVVKIAADIKNQYGLDLEHISVDSISIYSEYLQKGLRAKLQDNYYNSALSEEVELLSFSSDISIDEYQRLDFSEVLNKRSVGNYISDIIVSLGVTAPNFKYSVTHPHRVQLINIKTSEQNPLDSSKHYLVSSRLKVKNRECFVLYHFTIDWGNPYKAQPAGCFFFKVDNPRLNSPVRMFLQGVNEYGKEVSIGKNRKKFFLSLLASASDNIKTNSDFASAIDKKDEGDAMMFVHYTTKDNITQYNFTYLLVRYEIVDDAKAGIFL